MLTEGAGGSLQSTAEESAYLSGWGVLFPYHVAARKYVGDPLVITLLQVSLVSVSSLPQQIAFGAPALSPGISSKSTQYTSADS